MKLIDRFARAVAKRYPFPVPLPHPKDATTLALRGYQQLDDHSCGAVAGWSVVKSLYPHRSNFDRFYAVTGTAREAGTTLAGLARGLRESGVRVEYRRAVTHERLREWVDAGSAVVCLVRHARGDGDHWLVVYGYRVRPREVFVSGNGWLSHRLPWVEFKRVYRHHALVCCRPDGSGLRSASGGGG